MGVAVAARSWLGAVGVLVRLGASLECCSEGASFWDDLDDPVRTTPLRCLSWVIVEIDAPSTTCELKGRRWPRSSAEPLRPPAASPRVSPPSSQHASRRRQNEYPQRRPTATFTLCFVEFASRQGGWVAEPQPLGAQPQAGRRPRRMACSAAAAAVTDAAGAAAAWLAACVALRRCVPPHAFLSPQLRCGRFSSSVCSNYPASH